MKKRMGRPREIYNLSLFGRHIGQGTMEELAAITGEKVSKLRYDLSVSGKNRGVIAVENLGDGDFALYHGEKLIEIGTAEELARVQGVGVRTLKNYATPSHRKKVMGNKKYYQLEKI